jgi:hypothetical protein
VIIVKCGAVKTWIVVFALLALLNTPAEATPVEVRLKEGVTQGYLSVSVPGGARIAEGEVSQVATGADRLVSRMVLRFNDGSRYNETVIFSQLKFFKLLRYSVDQKGPSFPQDLHFDLDGGTGAYTILEGPASKENSSRTGTLELPPDVYNGMTVMVLKNLPESRQASFHIVSVDQEPTLYPVVVRAVDVDAVKTGNRKGEAVHYVLQPTVKWLTKVLAWLFSKTIPEYHFWLITHDVPAFTKFEGPLYPGGPIWRIEQISPRLATTQ